MLLARAGRSGCGMLSEQRAQSQLLGRLERDSQRGSSRIRRSSQGKTYALPRPPKIWHISFDCIESTYPRNMRLHSAMAPAAGALEEGEEEEEWVDGRGQLLKSKHAAPQALPLPAFV